MLKKLSCSNVAWNEPDYGSSLAHGLG